MMLMMRRIQPLGQAGPGELHERRDGRRERGAHHGLYQGHHRVHLPGAFTRFFVSKTIVNLFYGVDCDLQPEWKDVIPLFSVVNEALISTIGIPQMTTL